MRQFIFMLLVGLMARELPAQQLPEGPGRAETEKLCKQCHELARAISPRLDRDGWNTSMTKMTAFGMKSTEKEYQTVLDYLVKNFPAEDVPKVNVNKATAIELESGLSLKRSQAAALIAYRNKNGEFKSLEDLKKVPLIDVEKLESRKDRIAF
jgi:competence protein ComEA